MKTPGRTTGLLALVFSDATENQAAGCQNTRMLGYIYSVSYYVLGSVPKHRFRPIQL